MLMGMGQPKDPENAHLYDRAAELAIIQDAVAASVAGDGGFIAFEGPAGMGKSRLLSEAAVLSGVAGSLVRTARASELERAHSYGLVRQLFDPLLMAADNDQRSRWLNGTASQATAVIGPESLATQPVGDFAVLHGLYWLTVNLCQDGPLTLICDDLHWADEPSLRFLAYLLPRLGELPAAVFAGLRPATVDDSSPLLDMIVSDPACVTVRPGPLSVASTSALIEAMLDSTPDGDFIATCHTASRGNPLLLLECAEAAKQQGFSPTSANKELITKGANGLLNRRVRSWLRALPAECTRVAEAVAVLGDSASIPFAAKLSDLGETAVLDAVRRLQAANILAPDSAKAPNSCQFVHPLVQATIYGNIPATQRIEEHRRAWRLLESSHQPAEAVAAHLLRLPPQDDPAVVHSLESAATQALARGANQNAYQYLNRALAEPLTSGQRLSLLHRARAAVYRVDLTSFVARAREAYELETDRTEKARTATELGVGLLRAGRYVDGRSYLAEAITLLPSSEQDTRRRCFAAQAVVMLMVPHENGIPEFIDQCRALTPVPTYGGKVLDGILALWECHALEPHAVDRARRALEGGAVQIDRSSEAIFPIWMTLLAADAPEVMAILNDAVADVHRRGSSTGAALATMFRALGWLWRGALRDAELDARQALALVESTHMASAQAQVVTTLAEALLAQGRVDEAAQVLAQVATPEGIVNLEYQPVGYQTLLCHARLLRARGDHLGACEAALRAGNSDEALGGFNPAIVPWRSEAALNLIALGKKEEAAEYASRELDLAVKWRANRPIGHAKHVLALARLGESDGLALLDEAVSDLAASPARLDYAHALYDLGAAIRRSGQRKEAREHLTLALEVAEQCGATTLFERVRTELLAAGGHPGKHAASAETVLTPSEWRVAELAVTGQTNRQIPQALFITPKTVEVHLGNIYRKLNVSSRHHLAEMLSEQPGTA